MLLEKVSGAGRQEFRVGDQWGHQLQLEKVAGKQAGADRRNVVCAEANFFQQGYHKGSMGIQQQQDDHDSINCKLQTRRRLYARHQGAWCSQATNGGCSTSATQTTIELQVYEI
uniref:Uncharacterized protein n=1 Tax=Triticum urartu TaxID=4572 RepID=A0A8R7P3K4_TRIUA